MFSTKEVKYISINDKEVNWVHIRETGNEYLSRIKCYELNTCNDEVAVDHFSPSYMEFVLEVFSQNFCSRTMTMVWAF